MFYVEMLIIDRGKVHIPCDVVLLSSWNVVISDSQLFTPAVTVAEN